MRFIIVAIVVLAALPAFADDAPPLVQKKSGTIDCNKTPNVQIGNGKLKVTLTGTCKNLTMNGGESSIVADSVVNLSVNGASNKIIVNKVDNISLVGAKNEITFQGTVDPNNTTGPAVTTSGKDNVVKKGDQVVLDAAKNVDSKKASSDANKQLKDASKQIDDAAKTLQNLGK